jgi:hypothetical protein
VSIIVCVYTYLLEDCVEDARDLWCDQVLQDGDGGGEERQHLYIWYKRRMLYVNMFKRQY